MSKKCAKSPSQSFSKDHNVYVHLYIHSTTKQEINVNESERKLDKLTIYNKPLKIRSIVLTVVLHLFFLVNLDSFAM